MINKTIAPVSVVIPCFCCADTISRAIESVVTQTQKPAEVILVDDASGDDTLSVLRKIEQQYSGWVKVIALRENCGAASARNAGWAAATQTYVAFLDADDAWHHRKIEIQLQWMLVHSEFGLSGHNHLVLDRNGCVNEYQTSNFKPQTIHYKQVGKICSLFSNPFSTRTVMLKRSLPFKFKEGKRYIEDYQLWLEIILAHIPTAFINEPLAATFKDDYGAAGLSANLWKMEQGELDTYWQIYKKNKISFLMTMLLCVYSLIKYLKRIVVVIIRVCIKKI
ncbi:glycosyltransferase family 2 protein [Methylotenera sp.]|uniref:glycosyltransferase family 2 protein n=1 Tax=Methylotenera sp. TaxID=2051956 RepID=UPI0027314A2F|nr:glycosyltransferase family 2 protein [Methylotenera sp.]MDP2230724.1 glycosyltransferase family 2 protein [Methylotenera sp.]